MALEGKKILLGVSGSIAAYKAADLCSQLSKLGLDTTAVLTATAARFVGTPTFQALTRNPVYADLFDEPESKRIAHIDLAQSTSLVIVAPASANVIAKYAAGIADDMLTTCLIATPATTPVLIAPAMNTAMWDHPATQANLATLRSREVTIITPATGVLACGDTGTGKLAAVESIVEAILDQLNRVTPIYNPDFTGIRVLVTAGATREPIDPVRFITNRSSGKMGIALALAAAERGACVTLVSGHVSVPSPRHPKITVVSAQTAEQMHRATLELFPESDLFIGAAAVADFTPLEVNKQKIKKMSTDSYGSSDFTLQLKLTADIAAAVGSTKRTDQVVIGFAAESENLLANAARKIAAKKLDMIVANDITADGAGFDVDTNAVTLLWPDGRTVPLPQLSKRDVAERILDSVHPLLTSRLQASVGA